MPLLTVVPLALGSRREPLGVWVLPTGLTWTDVQDEAITDAAVRCLAEHFGLSTFAVYNGTAVDPDTKWPAVLASAGGFTDDNQRPRLVCVVVLRRHLHEWTVGHRLRDDVAWKPRNRAVGRPQDEMAIEVALEALRELLRRAPLAITLAGPIVSVANVRGIYDDLWGTQLDPPNFQRRFTSKTAGLLEPYLIRTVSSLEEADRLPGVVLTKTWNDTISGSWSMEREPSGSLRRGGTGRIPQLWIGGTAQTIDPPLQVPANAKWRPAALGTCQLPLGASAEAQEVRQWSSKSARRRRTAEPATKGGVQRSDRTRSKDEAATSDAQIAEPPQERKPR